MKKSLRSPEQERLQSMLRDARLQAGETQATLAARLGKPQSFVAKYETGERRIDVIELIRILYALNTRPETFVEELSRLLDGRGGSL